MSSRTCSCRGSTLTGSLFRMCSDYRRCVRGEGSGGGVRCAGVRDAWGGLPKLSASIYLSVKFYFIISSVLLPYIN